MKMHFYQYFDNKALGEVNIDILSFLIYGLPIPENPFTVGGV